MPTARCLAIAAVAASIGLTAGAAHADSYTVVAPPVLAGVPLSTDSNVRTATAATQIDFGRRLGPGARVVVAEYDVPGTDLMHAGASFIRRIAFTAVPMPTGPDGFADMFKVLSGSGEWSAVDDLAPVSTGPFGGTSECGRLPAGNTSMAVCAWSDSHTRGMVVFAGRTSAGAEADFPATRGRIEVPG